MTDLMCGEIVICLLVLMFSATWIQRCQFLWGQQCSRIVNVGSLCYILCKPAVSNETLNVTLFYFNLFGALFVSLFVLCFRLPFAIRFFTMNHWGGLRPPAVGIADTSFCCQLSVLPCSVLLWHATSCGWEVPERCQKMSALHAPEWHLSGAINNFSERSVLCVGDTLPLRYGCNLA